MATYGMSAENCTDYPQLQPNPDISGIGVTCGFLITAYLTLICCIVKTFLDNKPATKHINRWSFALERIILSLSDQQIITGISVIIGGASQLPYGISSYHWQNMVNLAWMSTVTHLITLTALRKELRSNQFNKILRITVMGVLMLMLICVTAPIGYLMATGGYYFESTDLPAEFPAWCLYNPSAVWNTGHDVNDPTTARMDYNWVYIALAIGILVFTYCTRVIMLFSDNIGYTLLRIPPGQPWIFIEKGLENNATDSSSKRGARVKDKLLRSASMILLSGNRLYGSKAWEITWLCIALVWGTLRIIFARSFDAFDPFDTWGHFSAGVTNEENIWGFGQVITIGLLALLFLSFFEAFFSSPRRELVDGNSVLSEDEAWDSLPHLKRLKDESWYRKLLALWCLASVGVAASVLFAFPVFESTRHLSDGETTSRLAIYFVAIVLGLPFALWLFTLVFLDRNIQRVWKFQTLRVTVPVNLLIFIEWSLLVILGVGSIGSYLFFFIFYLL